MGTISRRCTRESVGSIPSGCGFQNAAAQILVIEKIVSRPTASARKAMNHWPSSSVAFTTTNLAQNPDSGGKPASENAGIRKNTASHGAAL